MLIETLSAVHFLFLLPQQEAEPSGTLVYASNADGDYDLYLMDATGGAAKKLADVPGDETWPRWSPDGKEVLFCWEREGRSDLAVIAAGGGEPRLLTRDGVSREGAWSPDGERVVYRSSRDGNDELYVQDLDGSSVTRLTFDPASDWGPDWSPDGTAIVYATASPALEAIARVPAKGGERTILTDMPGEESTPRWSPSGDRIAFNAHPDGPSNELFTMGPDGEDARRVTFDSRKQRHASSFSPTWSPDGHWIVYTHMDATGDLDLYRIGADGGERVALTELPGAQSRADWKAGAEEESPPADAEGAPASGP